MSTIDYADLQDTAQQMIADYGVAVTFQQEASVFNESTGDTVTTVTPTPTVGALFQYKANEIDGTNILRDDVRLMMSAKEVQSPKVGDKVQIGSDVWRVMNVAAVKPGGVPVFFNLQLRK